MKTLPALLLMAISAPSLTAQTPASKPTDPIFCWGANDCRRSAAAGRHPCRQQLPERPAPMESFCTSSFAQCPSMHPRIFLRSCQVTLAPDIKHLTVSGRAMLVPKRSVRKIVVIGDTGCRVTKGEQQNCAKDWPFEKIAGFAAAQHPDRRQASPSSR